MTWPPAASMRAAAAITSITMNGGTSLRPDGEISRLADSSIGTSRCGYGTACPAVAAFGRFGAAQGRGKQARLAGYQLAEFGAMVAGDGHNSRRNQHLM